MSGINFASHKCGCGGQMIYQPDKNLWLCKYCDSTESIEGTIKVDGIEGVNDIVRVALDNISKGDITIAKGNVDDCERKGHDRVGTAYAHLAFSFMSVIAGKSQDDRRRGLDEFKKYAQRFRTERKDISPEEIDLIESFGDGADDIYAVLAVVFDQIKDNSRCEYMLSKMKVANVYSVIANDELLKWAISRGRQDYVDSIIANSSHLTIKKAFVAILKQYPDCDNKKAHIRNLFDARIADELGRDFFYGYFSNAPIGKREAAVDSLVTKCQVIELLNATEINCSADRLVQDLKAYIDSYESAKMLFDALYGRTLNDQETSEIFQYVISNGVPSYVQMAFFDALTEHNVFVRLSGRTVIDVLDDSSYNGEEKAELLRRLLKFNIDDKAYDVILNAYLSANHDDPEERKPIIDILLVEGAHISINTAKNYILNVSTDEENKLYVVKKIFDTGIKKTYFGDLLSEYLSKTKDQMKVKKAIADYLMTLGYKMDSANMNEFLGSDTSNEEKLSNIQRLVSNGSQLGGNSLDSYLASVSSSRDFSPEIMHLLMQGNVTLTSDSYVKYVLKINEMNKVTNAQRLINCVKDTGGLNMRGTACFGVNLKLNIAQLYVLKTTDDYSTASTILDSLINNGYRLTNDISVSGGSMKFKKFLGMHKSELTPITLKLCEERRMFSLF